MDKHATQIVTKASKHPKHGLKIEMVLNIAVGFDAKLKILLHSAALVFMFVFMFVV